MLKLLFIIYLYSKVKPYIQVTYIPTYTKEELGKKMRELGESNTPPSFLEATIYSEDKAVIQCGEFVDVVTNEQKAKVNSINLWFKPFYYRWVETFLEKGKSDEIIPLMDYYHRFTRYIIIHLN
jgi:delta24-sterol reductase